MKDTGITSGVKRDTKVAPGARIGEYNPGGTAGISFIREEASSRRKVWTSLEVSLYFIILFVRVGGIVDLFLENRYTVNKTCDWKSCISLLFEGNSCACRSIVYIGISVSASGSIVKAVRVQFLESRGLATKLVFNFEIYSPGEDPATKRKNAEKNPEDWEEVEGNLEDCSKNNIEIEEPSPRIQQVGN